MMSLQFDSGSTSKTLNFFLLWFNAGTESGFEPGGGPKHEQKKFHVTWFIKKKNHGRQKNCTLLPKYLSQEGYNKNQKI